MDKSGGNFRLTADRGGTERYGGPWFRPSAPRSALSTAPMVASNGRAVSGSQQAFRGPEAGGGTECSGFPRERQFIARLGGSDSS